MAEVEAWCYSHGSDEVYYSHSKNDYCCLACEEEEALITAMEIIDG